jgi:hypothetical protein
MNLNSNQLSFSTLTQSYDAVLIPSGTTGSTITLVTSGATNASVVTDILFRSADSTSRNFNIIIGASGDQSNAENNRVQITVPANSGNNGSTVISSLATLAPTLFDVDLAGNRVITLESGTNIYVQNTAQVTGNFIITSKRRNF